ncbi:DUF2332 domain-containing protein [Arthrobacter sp. UYCu712]|uniref:DUF2332 domain-containing protein n=1 Tax=Arthrobacter sp. UYCu712 TaxID=3156340 RepID=UPI00339915A7
MSPAESASAPSGSATAEWYRHFGTVDAPGNSACYAEWAVGIAADDDLIRRIDEWPYNKRQPLLMLAAARFLGAQISPYRQFRIFLDRHWQDVSRIVLSRATQTNEAGRCATLLPVLARIAAAEDRPLALLEVGASAGLALFPDRYGYEFRSAGQSEVGGPGARTGAREAAGAREVAGAREAAGAVTRLSPAGAAEGTFPVLHCTVTGPVPLPADLPRVVWRAGIDLNPLDVGDPEDVAWLEALIWPEQDFRRQRLRQAIDVARADPPLLVAGDLNEELLTLAGQAPPDAELVVFHSAVMGYLDAADRDRFRSTMAGLARDRGCHWLSNEGHSVILQADGSSVVPEMDEARLQGRFLLVLDGTPVAISGPHGQSLEWLPAATS